MSDFEKRATAALGELQAALARELATMAVLRGAVERHSSEAPALRSELGRYAKASSEAYAVWHALVVEGARP